MTFSDEELMVVFASGVKEAFDMLYERRRHGVYRFALASLREPADAEDVVQEVFLRVARAAPRYRPSGRFSAWLFQIAANRIRSVAARRTRTQRTEIDAFAPPEAVDSINPQREAEGRDLIAKALASLPEDQRMALVLKEIEGVDCRTIAEALGVSDGNARVILHRARRRLATVLDRLQGGMSDDERR